MPPLLLINPRSGSAAGELDELLEAAARLDVATHVLREGDDAASLARSADASALGVAGGDGSLAAVAAVAIERDLPFAVIPFGTRNHFARDAGIDPDDPVGALGAFGGSERRVDVGRIGERLFLNNVSFGAYAHLVHRREHHRRRRAAFARLRAFGIGLRRPAPLELRVNGEPLQAAILFVANNEYRLDILSVGVREQLDEGVLVAYATKRLLPWSWTSRRGPRFELEAAAPLRAAIDGEPVELDASVDLRIEPLGLRLLQPPA